MARKIDEQSSHSLQRECDALRSNETSEENIKESRDLHIRAQSLWRAMVIGVLEMYCPERYRRIFNFKDWDSAMKILKK